MAINKVGEVEKRLCNSLGINLVITDIVVDDGLRTHLINHNHNNMLPHFNDIEQIIKEADYIGVNSRHPNSFELVKVLNDNIQVGIKLNLNDGHYFVATMHEISDSKLNSRLQSGRLKKIK